MPAVVMLLSVSGLSPWCRRWVGRRARRDALGGEDVDEHHHEQQVDEVHGLHQADRQEEVLTGLGLDLGLAGDGRDGLRAGQAVTDGGTDGAAAEGEATADERAGDSYRTFNVFAAMFPLLCRDRECEIAVGSPRCLSARPGSCPCPGT